MSEIKMTTGAPTPPDHITDGPCSCAACRGLEAAISSARAIKALAEGCFMPESEAERAETHRKLDELAARRPPEASQAASPRRTVASMRLEVPTIEAVHVVRLEGPDGSVLQRMMLALREVARKEDWSYLVQGGGVQFDRPVASSTVLVHVVAELIP